MLPLWISLVTLLLTASQSFPEPHRASQSLSRLPKHPRVSQSIPELPKPFQSSQTATKAKTVKKQRQTTKIIDLTNDHSKNKEKTKKNKKNIDFSNYRNHEPWT